MPKDLREEFEFKESLAGLKEVGELLDHSAVCVSSGENHSTFGGCDTSSRDAVIQISGRTLRRVLHSIDNLVEVVDDYDRMKETEKDNEETPQASA